MATTSHVRRMNQRRIVETLARLGKASRLDLARESGISQPTVSRLVDEMLDQEILMEIADETQLAAGAGRPATPLRLDTRRPRYAVLQVGVRKTRLAVVPIATADSDRWEHEFDSPVTLDLWIEQLVGAWKAKGKSGLDAVVVSLPGVVDEEAGRVLLSPNLRWTERDDFGRKLKGIFGDLPILFSQEIRTLALGRLAIEPELRDFLLVDSGSGLGAAAVLRGQLYHGALPLSGEIGHIRILGNRRLCGCSAMGCSETLISRPGMLASAKEQGLADTWPQLLETLAMRRMPGWFRQTLEQAAVMIVSALNVLGLRDVVLTGAFAELPPACIDFLKDHICGDAMWARFGTVSCKTAPRRRQTGMVCVAMSRTLFAEPTERKAS